MPSSRDCQHSISDRRTGPRPQVVAVAARHEHRPAISRPNAIRPTTETRLQVGQAERLALVVEDVVIERHHGEGRNVLNHLVAFLVGVRLAPIMLAPAFVTYLATGTARAEIRKRKVARREAGNVLVYVAIVWVVVLVILRPGGGVVTDLCRAAHSVPFDPGILARVGPIRSPATSPHSLATREVTPVSAIVNSTSAPPMP